MEIVVVLHREDMALCTRACREALGEHFGVSQVIAGGPSRQESVLAGLEATNPDAALVLIHDAVRPLVRTQTVENVARRAGRCGAAVAAVLARATVKEAGRQGEVLRSPPRQSLWLAQTPQGFRRRLILRAHHLARAEGFVGTDDALLVERLGQRVELVEGSDDNIKITSPVDMVVASAILRWQRKQEVPEADVPSSCRELFCAL